MSLRTMCIVVPLVLGCAPGSNPGDSTESEPGLTTSSISLAEPSATVAPTTTSGSQTTTSGSQTTASGTTDDDTSTTTSVAPFCGDDNVDLGEECDLGRDNSDVGACTLKCHNATCGDNLVFQPYEECDLGRGNTNEYGGCTSECTKAPYCGDGKLDLGHEECDLGSFNGKGNPNNKEADCSDTCRWRGRVVFLSSSIYKGDLDGLQGADKHCSILAKNANIDPDREFMAWLSDGAESAVDRLAKTAILGIPYVQLDGTKVANDLPSLVKDGPIPGISIMENTVDMRLAFVWTGTDIDGTLLDTMDHCNNWTSSATGKGGYGLNRLKVEQGDDFEAWQKERGWTKILPSLPCSYAFRLYCFEK